MEQLHLRPAPPPPKKPPLADYREVKTGARPAGERDGVLGDAGPDSETVLPVILLMIAILAVIYLFLRAL